MNTLPTHRHTADPLPDVADLPAGTRIWFQLGTGTVVVGELLAGEPHDHGYSVHDADGRVARVTIDMTTVPSSGDRPAHVAPEDVQPAETIDNGWFFRDAWCISVAEQTYIVTDDTLVAVRDDVDDGEGR